MLQNIFPKKPFFFKILKCPNLLNAIVPINEDEVDFGKNNFTGGNDFEDEDDAIDDDEKNDEMVIDDKYLDDEEL